MRQCQGELETCPDPCVGTDCPSDDQLSGGFPFQPLPTARFPHYYLFTRTLRVRTFSISVRLLICNEEKSHDDRFFLRSYTVDRKDSNLRGAANPNRREKRYL
jgi:hypothetical protein